MKWVKCNRSTFFCSKLVDSAASPAAGSRRFPLGVAVGTRTGPPLADRGVWDRDKNQRGRSPRASASEQCAAFTDSDLERHAEKVDTSGYNTPLEKNWEVIYVLPPL